MSKKQDDFNFNFKNEITYGNSTLLFSYFFIERRVIESQKILEKYQGRIPVIIEKASTEKALADLEQTK